MTHPETSLSAFWIIPFVGILASIALLPMVAPHFWHRRYGLVALFWALAFIVPYAAIYGAEIAGHDLLHAILLEYIPFIILIAALFIISGGIQVSGHLHGAPGLNMTLILAGMGLASFVGTTGASMIMIRPLLRANDDRLHRHHVVVFFIFLVSNIGGALTPLGDPPLFLGYLKGVSFFWPLQHLWQKTLIVTAIVLVIFYVVDRHLYRKEGRTAPAERDSPIRIHGAWINVPLVLLLAATVAASGADNALGHVTISGIEVSGTSLARDGVMILLALISLALTPRAYREANDFSWHPVIEVAKLFAAIFITIVPAIAILKAGPHGAFASLFPLLGSVEEPHNAAYFWLTGAISSVLDNAPAYLIFFNAAGGDPGILMTSDAETLAAVSAGSVFMGAMTYIGNAPNFMVKSIAEKQGVPMPSFFGYVLWSAFCLLPPFLLITLLFFR